MNRIDQLFETVRSARRPAFMPFLTAGDPDLETTVTLAQRLVDAAKRREIPLLFEIGFPYSDPIADGATIQSSFTRALAHHIKLSAVFDAIAALRRACDVPLVAMVSYSLVYRQGPKVFFERAAKAGFDGLILPDLPVEETDEVVGLGAELGLKMIPLIAPTTSEARMVEILRRASGFVYYISVTGITGERDKLPDDLPQRIEKLRQLTPLPLCVGFGISKPEHVAQLRGHADGVIVGSAIVRQLASLRPDNAVAIDKLVESVTALMAPLAGT